MTRIISTYLPGVLFLAVVLGILAFPEPIDYLKQLVGEGGFISYGVFVLLLVAATVLVPVTVLPIIPMSATLIGPLPTAILSIIGWTLGSSIAFLISRHLGRPILVQFISLEKIDAFTASLPQDTRFLGVVLLRLTLPVDLVSYALGLTKSLGFLEYFLGTLVGVVWFSFAFAYLGEALITGNTSLLIMLGGASLLIFLLGWYMLRRTRVKK